MKLVVDVPEHLVEQVRETVEREGYEDAREFVTTALENQIEMERDETEAIPTLDEAIGSVDSGQSTGRDSTTERTTPESKLARRAYDDVVPLAPPPGGRLDSGPLWGQYNRLFPVKLVLRYLANELQAKEASGDDAANKDSYVERDPFSEDAARLARTFGREVASYDEQYSRSRGEKLAAGLPTGDDAEKSKDRFQTHFVGYADRNEKLTGAPPELRLVDITIEEISRIGLTKAGLTFAHLKNPLLDEGPDAEASLSDDERQFYLDHVRESVEDEHAAMVTAARNISEGVNRPDELTGAIATLNHEWSDRQASTVRSGLIGRMAELGLVERERVGQRGIAYVLTSAGEHFLDDAAGDQ